MVKKIGIVISIIILLLSVEASVLAIPKNSENNNFVNSFNDRSFPSSPGDYFRFMISDWRIRSYKIHIPSSYDGNTQTPLILVLHGGGGRALSMESKTEFSAKADEEGFIVVYPNGNSRFPTIFERRWNSGHAGGFALDRNIDDVGFISKLINKLQSKLNIDSDKIYVTGHFVTGVLLQLL